MPYALQSFAACTPVPYMTYSDAVVDAPPEVRHEWWIYSRLAEASGATMFGKGWLARLLSWNTRLAYSPRRWLRNLAMTPEKIIDGMLKKGGLSGRRGFLRDHRHGMLLPQNKGGNFLGTARVLTENARIQLAPAAYLQTFNAVAEALFAEERARRHEFKLIGKREIKRMNTASANVPRLVKEETNYAYVNGQDAQSLGVQTGDHVTV